MGKLGPLAIVAGIIDLLVPGVYVAHLSSVANRPRVPFSVSGTDKSIFARTLPDAKCRGAMQRGDEILTRDSQPFCPAMPRRLVKLGADPDAH